MGKREITSHKVDGLNEALRVYATDGPGAGGASHEYAITFFDERFNCERSPVAGRNCLVTFQKGPIGESGVNGISNEALLAIVEDRLEGFQSGPFACNDNATALMHVRGALQWLHKRTKERAARGVEGTMKP